MLRRRVRCLRQRTTSQSSIIGSVMSSTRAEPLRRAVLFLYLNRHGYNGLCRYNLRGEFNVPFGRYKKPYFPEAELYHFAEKAQHAEFHCESYEECMKRADNRSVVYCDPPYAPLSSTANFTAYHTNSFSQSSRSCWLKRRNR